MRRVVGLLLAVALAPPARGATELLVSATAGGGWDSNPSGASAAGYGDGAALTYARLAAAAAFDAPARSLIQLELGYDGTVFPDLPDLSMHRPFVTAAWRRPLGGRTMVRLSGTAGARYYGDDMRNGWDAGAAVLLRVRLARPLALRFVGGYTHRGADDRVFGWDSGRAGAGLELDLSRRAYALVAYSASFGSDTFYATAPLASSTASGSEDPPSGAGPGDRGPGGGSGAPVDASGSPGSSDSHGPGPAGRPSIPVPTFGEGVVAYSANRIAHTASIDVAYDLPRRFSLQGGYAYSDVRGDEQRYAAHLVTADVSWRY